MRTGRSSRSWLLGCLLLACLFPASPGHLWAETLDPAPGRLLVAPESSRDPYFARSVVLLLEYDSRGALGLILNRPIGARVSEMLPDLEGQLDPGLYYGGPVETDLLKLLVRSDAPLSQGNHVFGEVYWSGERELLERLTRVQHTRRMFRVYAGYAGWGAGQLDREIADGRWHVMAAHESYVFFNRPADQVWPRLVPRDRNRLRAGSPDLPFGPIEVARVDPLGAFKDVIQRVDPLDAFKHRIARVDPLEPYKEIACATPIR